MIFAVYREMISQASEKVHIRRSMFFEFRRDSNATAAITHIYDI